MFYFSPKLLVTSVSGIGVVGCGLLTWQLIKENKHKKPDSRISKDNVQKSESLWEKSEVKEECGNDVWGQSNFDENKTNNKEMNWDSYRTCLIKHLTSKK